MISGRVLILGGAGFLGRGIMRQAIAEKWPAEFTIFSRDELKQHLCKHQYPFARYLLGDIRDTDRLTLAMAGHDVVIHAAALKFIPEAEFNVSECVHINIFGTESVIKAAIAAGVKSVVFISTDKAVQPLNTYGLTKALGERLICEVALQIGPAGATKFVTCRYGNVIGSTGSVVPVFKRQLDQHGFVSVTDPEMTRFWISVDEAVDIIEITLAQQTGTITVPEPKAMKIGAIAAAIAGETVEIVGLRPGEKMDEILLTEQESLKTQVSIMAGINYNVYFPMLHTSIRPVEQAYELKSSAAELINAEEFMALVEDAENV